MKMGIFHCYVCLPEEGIPNSEFGESDIKVKMGTQTPGFTAIETPIVDGQNQLLENCFLCVCVVVIPVAASRYRYYMYIYRFSWTSV